MDTYLHITKTNHAILTMIGCSGVLNLPSSEIGFVLSPLSFRFLTIPVRISQIKPKVILQQFLSYHEHTDMLNPDGIGE